MIYSEKNIIFALEYQLYWLMAKGKNRGKRLTKKRLVEMLSTFFTTNPNETYNLKQIFKQLHLLTHPDLQPLLEFVPVGIQGHVPPEIRVVGTVVERTVTLP